MLQVRIRDADGSNVVILDQAKSKNYFKSVSSADEGLTFEIAKNSPKADVINPDLEGYKKYWEVWDTVKNERLNYGPITSITEANEDWKVEGAGRSAILRDFIKTKKTFYAAIDSIVDDLRYENIAIEPRTTTLAGEMPVTLERGVVLGSNVDPNSKYYGLSQQTKDNVIDDDQGLFKPGEIEPTNTYFSTDSFWAGMSTADTHIIDLGDTYDISKVTVVLPYWGGKERKGNRAYEFSLDYADDETGTITHYKNRRFGDWTEFYTTESDRLIMGPDPTTYYFGTTASGTSIDFPVYYVKQDLEGPVNLRYIRTRIHDVHAWYGGVFDDLPPNDGYRFQCDPSYESGDLPWITGDGPGIMEGSVISDRILEPQNDCHASISEIGIFKEIMTRDTIKPLALQRIDNNNLQITYSHAPDTGDVETTEEGFKKYEPGGYFRKFRINWQNASNNYNIFYGTDCSNCYPDGFNFGIVDQYNNLIYSTDTADGSNVLIQAPAFTSSILTKGSSNVSISYVDSWPSVSDPLSWGGSYSYTTEANDFAIVHFRGESFKWYATVPPSSTGAEVRIEIRHKDIPRVTTGTPGNPAHWETEAWTSWTTLEDNYPLPNNISSELVYEITYESGTLLSDTVYEIKITNLDGGYCSIDSIEGYWSGSMTTYNEDTKRINISAPERFLQIYDKRFSGGSMYKWNTNAFMNFHFEGDRVVVYGAKGKNHGRISIGLIRANGRPIYDDYPNVNNILIPGGDSNGRLVVDLDTGSRGQEITQAIIFDSNDAFPDGLPWDKYLLGVYLLPSDIETFTTPDPNQFDNFVDRCSDCVTPTGTPAEVNKYVYFDGLSVHERVGLSISFENEEHLEILTSVAEAIQAEWDITEEGIRIEPRIGTDTEVVLREGHNATISWNLVNDTTNIASMLVSSGADIDGLPLFSITEDKETRADLGRTIMRKEDFRNIADYFQLIGLQRTSLRKRKAPEKRISVSTTEDFDLDQGDSFILYTKKQGPLRVRVSRKSRLESSASGTTYDLECIKWPQII